MGLLRRSLILAVLAVVSPLAAALDAQQGRIAADTDARSAPAGGVVAQLRGGTSWTTGTTRNGFTSVVIDAWVDASRFGPARDSFPVTIGGTANLRIREQPSLQGRILGSFRAGAGMRIIERRDTWARIRREVWVPSSAITVQAATRPAPSGASTQPNRPATTQPNRPATSQPNRPTTETPVPVAPPEPVMAPNAQGASGESGSSAALRSDREVPLRLGPNGQVLGMLDSGVIVTPQARDRGWVRVRIEGWVPESHFIPADTAFGATLTAADLRADPEGHRGRLVRWQVQVVGMHTADPLRRDMARDERFLLVIGPPGENATIYVTVPQRLVDDARAIPALSNIILTARVRTGRSNPTGAPILDMVSFAKP